MVKKESICKVKHFLVGEDERMRERGCLLEGHNKFNNPDHDLAFEVTIEHIEEVDIVLIS